MAVKSSKSAIYKLWIGTMVAVAALIGMKYYFDGPWTFSLVPMCILILGSLRYWIAVGRTLTFSPDGCTVSFLRYSKHYTWDDLKLKRYQDFGAHLRRIHPYEKGAVFAKRDVYRFSWYVIMEPQSYCFFFHPLSFFYVFFVPKGASEEQTKRLYKEGYYTVDETEFRAKLTEWGVKMDEV